MGIGIKTEYKKFKIFMFAYWVMMLSIAGMYSMYIVQAGFSKKEISIAVTIFTVSSLAGQIFIGYIADRTKRVKKILLISISVGIVVTAALIFAKQNWCIYIMILLWGFFLYGTVSLSEAWYIEILKENSTQKDFGKIRGFGSVGYGVSGVLLGFLLQNVGWSIYFWYILLSACFVLLVILMMTDNKGISLYKGSDGRKEDNGDISFKSALHEIVRIKPLRYIIIIVFIYNFVVKGIYNYLGVLVSDFGGGPLSLGFAYFFDATPEVITFFLTTRLLNKYRSKGLIFTAFVLQIIRLSLILVFNSPLSIILLGSLSGFAYGLLATAYKTYIYELAPDKYKISCLSLSESIIGLAGVLSAPVFGLIITMFSGYTSIVAGLCIYIAAAVFMAFNIYGERKKTLGP
ncbi:MAG: MFS transporter [Clostridiaceae bacterium]